MAREMEQRDAPALERSDSPVGPTYPGRRSVGEGGRSGASQGSRVSESSDIPGLEYERFFSQEGADPFDEIEWDLRSAIIGSEKGEVVFEQRDVEIPRFWSQQATNIVVSKYFRGQIGTPERERSVKQLIGRVVETVTAWAAKQQYFASDEDLHAFSDDLKHLLVYQKAAFNSPVWFNVGFEKAPQCSACFINSVQDTMESILGLAKTEGMLFKFGSGTGSNLSNIRSSKEFLAGGGTASGPVSFMKGFDAFAGVIKSGGKTRRAAKMVILNAEHPDIVEFINCKVEEEKKAWALIDAGYDGSFTGVAYGSVFFQNSNNSVRVTDEFMRAVLDDGEWTTRAVVTGEPMETYKARDLMRMIAEGTWVCGDPGMQFDTTINDWHTCPNTARINRPLGLGYANLGALLMSRGLPYDSEAGRDYAATITALMHGAAYAESSRIARDHGGPFTGYVQNKDPMLRVMRKHRAAIKDIDKTHVPKDLLESAKAVWDEVIEMGEQHGFRNAQATVLAPTGTIGFMMDCDTTGVEPDIALVKYKKLVGGGMMKIVNQTVPMALKKLGYTQAQIKDVIEYIDEHETIEGAPHVKEPHMAVFDCAFKPMRGTRSIHYMGHIKMVGATQPFLSGAISKTVNVPKDATVEEIQQAYVDAWRMGAKAVSIYRDGSKRTQPLNTSKQAILNAGVIKDAHGNIVGVAQGFSPADAGPRRHKLPDERHAITHKFDIAGHEGYITVGLFEDGMPGEIFLVMAKEGSTISGFADAFAQAISYALQYGVPLQDLVDKFSHVRFEPSGMTRNPDVRFAKSIVDYIFRWMAAKFLSPEAQFRAGVNNREEVTTTPEQLPLDVKATATESPVGPTFRSGVSGKPASFAAIQNQEDAPPCSTCGSIMVRSGACYKCTNCGTTSGCA